jgi:hypothetical protein
LRTETKGFKDLENLWQTGGLRIGLRAEFQPFAGYSPLNKKKDLPSIYRGSSFVSSTCSSGCSGKQHLNQQTNFILSRIFVA